MLLPSQKAEIQTYFIFIPRTIIHTSQTDDLLGVQWNDMIFPLLCGVSQQFLCDLKKEKKKLVSFPAWFQAMKAEGIRGRKPTVLYRPGAVGKGHKAAVVSEFVQCSHVTSPSHVTACLTQQRHKQTPPGTAEPWTRGSSLVKNVHRRELLSTW